MHSSTPVRIDLYALLKLNDTDNALSVCEKIGDYLGYESSTTKSEIEIHKGQNYSLLRKYLKLLKDKLKDIAKEELEESL
jgi:hypothetical protein